MRLAIASGIVGFFYIPGDINPADILSTHWGYYQIRESIKLLLFWKGDTADILVENPKPQAKGETQYFVQNYSRNFFSICLPKVTGEVLFFYVEFT
jgi:hypothetical protein